MPKEAQKGAGDMQTEILRYRLERQKSAQSYNGEMAKWILASLILVNGAPFFLASKDVPGLAKAVIDQACYFTPAIALAILCGFSAWLNTGMREAVYGYQVTRQIDEADAPPGTKVPATKAELISGKLVKVGYAASLLTGFGSLALFLVGALSLSRAYDGEPPKSAATTVAAPQLPGKVASNGAHP